MPELEHVGKTYAEHRVLDDIDLAIEDGRIVSVLGPSGGGKTTPLNILLGITDATDGQILWNGDDITRTPMDAHAHGEARLQHRLSGMPWRLLCRREALLARQRGDIDVVTTGTVDKPRLDFSSPRWRAFDDHAIFELQLDFALC